MSIKHKLIASWHKFLQVNFNTYLRSAPTIGKEPNSFNEYESERKNQRLQLIQYKQQLRKRILERELKLIDSTRVDIIGDERRVTQNSELNQEILERVRIQVPLDDESRKSILMKQIADIESDLKIIENERREQIVIQKQIDELEPDMMIVEGTQKKIVLNLIQYYEFQQRHIAGVFLNPETQKSMEIVHYHVQNNLPIKRELIYEAVPELFEQEIGELEEYKRKLIESKRPSLITDSDCIIGVVERLPKSQEKDKLEFYELLRSQEMEMMDFVYKKAQEFCDKYDDYIVMRQGQGLALDEIFEALDIRKADEVAENEMNQWTDYHEIKKINEDYNELIMLNKVRVFKEQRELYIPDFVKQSERLTQAWIQKWEQIIKNSFDIKDSFLVPYDNTYESKLDYTLTQQTKTDIASLIEQSQLEYTSKILSHDVPVRQQDRRQKDEQIVKKVQVMTDIMHNLPTDQEMKKIVSDRRKMDDPALLYRSEEGRIMLDELPKLLFLNNQDPQKYDLLYWATHFNIEPQKLRNIVNFISYPIISGDSKKETSRILRFIQFNKREQSQALQ